MTSARLCLLSLVVVAASVTASCAALGGLGGIVQPPRFDEADGREAELRLMGPSVDQPLGGAGVRMWLEVENPNTFGFTLSAVRATLMLEGSRAATGDFPLGLPLQARQTTVIPLDLSISFSDLPALAGNLTPRRDWRRHSVCTRRNGDSRRGPAGRAVVRADAADDRRAPRRPSGSTEVNGHHRAAVANVQARADECRRRP